jgi:hypothetical protein
MPREQPIIRANNGSSGPSISQLGHIVVKLNVILLLLASGYWTYTLGIQNGERTQRLQLQDDSSALPQQQTINKVIASPLQIPLGAAQALPSIQVETEEVQRGIYGGKGDKKHLGGFTAYDPHGVSPAVWKHMITDFGVKTLMDVGCGKGISTLWFALHGVEVLCIEGSHDAVQNTLLPDPANQVVEHDFSRGPYWPGKTYDALWCVEFLEHVGRNYQYNYIQAFRKAALIFVTHSIWGGWHHVEVHNSDWWVVKLESFGFRYSEILTEKVRQLAAEDKTDLGPDGKPLNAQHVWLTMKVCTLNPHEREALKVAVSRTSKFLFDQHGDCFCLDLLSGIYKPSCSFSSRACSFAVRAWLL